MNVRVRATPDETRARIINAADELFRRLGFAKTAVSDIASALGMSPANVYRFFPSKHAIVEAICARCLGEVEERIWAVARSKDPAPVRLERLILAILSHFKEMFLREQRVHEMVQVAIEHSWDTIRAHRQRVVGVIELILREGIDEGSFEPHDTREASQIIKGALLRFMHPMLIARGIEEDLEGQARATLRFLLRAITPRR